MKAAILRTYGATPALDYGDLATPSPAAGEVLVRVKAASINPIDWMLCAGIIKSIFPVDLPYVPGFDIAGVVEAVGDGVDGFAAGDAVMALGANGFAEYCLVAAPILVKMPEGLDFETAAALPLVNVTGDLLVRQGAKVQTGQTVLVTGALGSVGRSAVFAAASAGAKVIAGVRPGRVDEALELPGVVDAIALDDAGMEGLDPVDCIADTVGGEIAARLLGKLKPGGVFGCFPASMQTSDERTDIEINGVFAQPDPGTTLRYAEAVRDGRLSIPVDRVMPLADAAEGLILAQRSGVAKIVLRP
jgi:NADPH:quinone reductase-like Zn-dependent oxidoreductase